MSAVSRIRYPFAINAGSGRLRQEPDYEEYLRQLIRQVIFTAPGDRVNRPSFGAGIRRLIFAPNSVNTASLAQTMIYQSLTNSLGTLIKVDDVQVSAENEMLNIAVAYTVLQKGEQRFLNIETTL